MARGLCGAPLAAADFDLEAVAAVHQALREMDGAEGGDGGASDVAVFHTAPEGVGIAAAAEAGDAEAARGVLQPRAPTATKVKAAVKPKASTSDTVAAPAVSLDKAIDMVNAGRFAEAKVALSALADAHSGNCGGDGGSLLGVLVTLGTCHSLAGELADGVKSFDQALALSPSCGEARLRRAQALSALGRLDEARADLDLMIHQAPPVMRGKLLEQRAALALMRRDHSAAAEDLRAAIGCGDAGPNVWRSLAVALNSTGDYGAAVEAYERAFTASGGGDVISLAHLANLHKEYGDANAARKALARALAADSQCALARAHAAAVEHCAGCHVEAAAAAGRAADADAGGLYVRYIRGVSLHALGDLAGAVAMYEDVLRVAADPGHGPSTAPPAGVERLPEREVAAPVAAWYQRELAFWLVGVLDRPLAEYLPDTELEATLKTAVCRKGDPKLLVQAYTPRSVTPEALARCSGRVVASARHSLRPLLAAADALGGRLQYRCPGFMANARQQRQGGLAMLTVAQAARRALRDQRAAASVALWGKEAVGWREMYGAAVRWRQISEPNDCVFWIDLLTPEAFKQGFGSHTPILTGQTRSARYYSQCARCLGIVKRLARERGEVRAADESAIRLSPAQLERLERAGSVSAAFDAVGQTFWVVTPCGQMHTSAASREAPLDGLRLTVQRLPANDDSSSDARICEFSIRTPCMPRRWREYDQEMAAAWDSYVLAGKAALNQAAADADARKRAVRAALRLAYYWYNMVPLSRGGSAVGLVTLHGLLLAAGCGAAVQPPPGVQVDWEAMLAPTLADFCRAVEPWLIPAALSVEDSEGGGRGALGDGVDPEEMPVVAIAVSTAREALAALNCETS